MASAATEAAKSSLQNYQALGSDTAMEQANQKYDTAGSQTRLSALKGIVGNLQSSVEAVDPSVTGRTSGTFTTEGQRQALVSKERAPILGDLNKQQQAYTGEQQDYTQKQTLASQMASALLSDDKSKYQRLLDQYNSSTAQDTADEQRRQADQQAQQWQQQFNESQRQYNETLANSKAQSAASRASDTASASNVPHAQQRGDKGFNFQDAGGKAISARTYAAQAGMDFNALLKQMSKAGDAGASDVLKNGAKSKYYQNIAWG